MRKKILYIVTVLLLAGGAVLCAIRWQAWFGMPDEPQWHGERLDYRFPAFEQDTTPESLDLLVLGDIHNRLLRADYDTLAVRVPQADAVVQVGDWLERGYPYYYQLLLREWSQSRLYGMPVIACPGNHEYSKGLHKGLSEVWDYAFPHPHNGPEGVPGVSYYIDLGAVRLIALDTNPLDRLVWLTRTQTWLQRAMAEAGERYVVVIMHHPVLSARQGRHNALIHATFRLPLNKADLVIAGHDHSYMQRVPFIVLNTAGKPKAQKEYLASDSTVMTHTEPVYAVLSVGADRGLIFRAYTLQSGAMIDSIYVKHN